MGKRAKSKQFRTAPSASVSSALASTGGNGVSVPAATTHRFSYDAASPGTRRRMPATLLSKEDEILTYSKRRALVSTTRDLLRNFAVASWAVRKHLDYVSTFSFQSRTGNDALDTRIEELMDWWQRPANCDAAGKHPLQRIIRIAEARRVVDGDVFVHKLDLGLLQGIEGDRVNSENLGFPQGMADMVKSLTKENGWYYGIKLQDGGRATDYCITSRDGNAYLFESIIPAQFIRHHGCFERFDQIRGVSPLAAALNTFRDLYEARDYALAKLKVAQMFGLVFYREASEALGTVTGTDDGSNGETAPYEVSFDKGPVLLDLDPGDKAEFLESGTPSSETQAFIENSTAIALKSLDIPYSFFDESHTNYSGARQAWIQYEQSAAIKRADVRALLDDLTRWRLNMFIRDGVLDASPRELAWEWMPMGQPWIDPLKEIKADVEAVNYGLTTRADVIKRRTGRDFREVMDQLAAEQQYIRAAGIELGDPDVVKSEQTVDTDDSKEDPDNADE